MGLIIIVELGILIFIMIRIKSILLDMRESDLAELVHASADIQDSFNDFANRLHNHLCYLENAFCDSCRKVGDKDESNISDSDCFPFN